MEKKILKAKELKYHKKLSTIDKVKYKIGLKIPSFDMSFVSEIDSKKPTKYLPDVATDSFVGKVLLAPPLLLCYALPRALTFKFVDSLQRKYLKKYISVKQELNNLEEKE